MKALTVGLVTSALLLSCSREMPPTPTQEPAQELRDAIASLDLAKVKALTPKTISIDQEVGTGVHPPGDTPLALVLWEANKIRRSEMAVEIMKYLIDEGADVNRPDRNGRTLLHFPHNYDAVKILLNNGAKVDTYASDDGTSPLYRTDNLRLLGLLVPVAKNINSIDKSGKTALDYHMQWDYSRKEIISLLRAHGAKTSAELEIHNQLLHRTAPTADAVSEVDEL